MTGQTVSTLTCDRIVYPTTEYFEERLCGKQLQAVGPLDALRRSAAREGWAHRGQHDYCSVHA